MAFRNVPKPAPLVYTKSSVDTTIGAKIPIPRAMALTRMRAQVGLAPAGGALSYKLVKNGADLGNPGSIADGQTQGPLQALGVSVAAGDTLQVQATALNAATGPFVVVIETG